MEEYALLAVSFLVCVGVVAAIIMLIHWAWDRCAAWCERVFEDDDSY